MSANKEVRLVIDDRKLQILRAIIQDYISTGEPVGSRTIAKKYNLGVSSATIRNEMADLEDMGFLEQPHTSAGRIPFFIISNENFEFCLIYSLISLFFFYLLQFIP